MSRSLANPDNLYSSDPQLKKTDILDIFQWLKTQPHLPELTELQVILFLHSCYYNLESTKTTIANYFTLKTTSELFQCPNEETLKNTMSKMLILILPKRTPEGYSVMITSLLDTRPEEYSCVENFRLIVMVLILHLHQHGPANGFILIADTGTTTFGHMLRMKLSLVKQILYFLQEAAPIRVKSMHFVNCAPVTRHLVALTRPFLKKEIYDLMRLHTYSMESLYEYVPREFLPKEYGGELPSYLELNEDNIRNVVNNQEFFQWHSNQNIDDCKRISERKGFRDLFKF